MTSLPKEMCLTDMNEALKVMKLYDENNDDRLTSREFKELLKPDFKPPESLVNIIPSPIPSIPYL